ncbi:hypothetical protein C8R45DRAFT_1083048 [Mycena sanguinolenta]|nr:hypothetical protein C8R45DRAFT_1083048 [Mycena sanguinolenta]
MSASYPIPADSAPQSGRHTNSSNRTPLAGHRAQPAGPPPSSPILEASLIRARSQTPSVALDSGDPHPSPTQNTQAVRCAIRVDGIELERKGNAVGAARKSLSLGASIARRKSAGIASVRILLAVTARKDKRVVHKGADCEGCPRFQPKAAYIPMSTSSCPPASASPSLAKSEARRAPEVLFHPYTCGYAAARVEPENRGLAVGDGGALPILTSLRPPASVSASLPHTETEELVLGVQLSSCPTATLEGEGRRATPSGFGSYAMDRKSAREEEPDDESDEVVFVPTDHGAPSSNEGARAKEMRPTAFNRALWIERGGPKKTHTERTRRVRMCEIQCTVPPPLCAGARGAPVEGRRAKKKEKEITEDEGGVADERNNYEIRSASKRTRIKKNQKNAELEDHEERRKTGKEAYQQYEARPRQTSGPTEEKAKGKGTANRNCKANAESSEKLEAPSGYEKDKKEHVNDAVQGAIALRVRRKCPARLDTSSPNPR